MSLLQKIAPGDKIDIQLVQETGMEEQTGETTKIYKSSLLDFTEDEDLEISMPFEGTKMILLPSGVRFHFQFYAKGGMYGCTGVVTDRYKKGTLYILLVHPTSKLEKIQRREYFRMPCSIETTCYPLDEETARLDSIEEIFAKLREEEGFYETKKSGTILDISGGGIRFTSDQQFASQSYLLIVMHLSNEKMDQQFYMVIKIISCQKADGDSQKYIHRAKFLVKDAKTREEIIRYIFDEERKARKKENG